VALITKTVDGSGTGSFTSNITGLSSGVKYYVRSYATNSSGTAYGAEINFTTLDTEVPTAFTATTGSVTFNSVELLLNATDNSGSINYTISYGSGPTVVNTTGTSGVQKSNIITGLTASTDYSFSVVAKDASNNAAANNPIIVTATTTENTNTECSGFSTEKLQELDFLTGYNYTFSTTGSGTTASVKVDFELLDNRTGVNAYAWTYNPNFAEAAMTLVSGKKYTKTFTNQTIGATFTVACKFSFAGGMSVTKKFLYTVGNSCLTVPGKPTSVVATAGNGQASVTFTAPASNGGSAITGYTVTSSPGSFTSSGASSPLVVNGLTNGTAYTFSVTATNIIGTGAASSSSNSATPATTPDAPTIGTITPLNSQLSVAFTAGATGGSTITNYKYSTDNGSTFTACSPAQTTSPVVITGLTNGTPYNVQLKAVNAIGDGTATASTAATPATIPGAPTIGTITPTDGTLSIAFTAGTTGGSAITNYKYSTNGGGLFTACSPTQTTSPIVITGLSNGTSYNIQIMAVNANGDGTATVSTAATPSVAAIAPSAPTITGITPSSGQLSVAFTAGSNGGSAITNYKYSSDNGSTFTACSPEQTNSPVVITGLTNGTLYNIQLIAVNAIGDGTATSSTAATPANVPDAPTIGTATAGNAQASVVFTAPESNGGSSITSYTATSSPDGFTSVGASSPLVVSGLTNGTAYTFTVTATNVIGIGAPSSASNSVTPATTPGAPTIGVITPANGQLSVAFTAGSTGGSAITNYKYSSDNGATFTACSPEQTTSPVVITGLTNGTPYSVQLKAVNIVGDGTATASTAATPATTPGAPTIGTATFGNAQASVTFTAPVSNGGSSVTGYTATSNPGGFTASGATSPLVVTGLTNGTSYTFTVTATNIIGTGNPSSASNSVTPLSNIPVIAAPTPPTRVAGDVKSIFSDAYTPIAGTTDFFPGWGQVTTVTNVSVEGNTTMKYSTFNYEGTNLGSDLNLTSLGMTHLHLDVWSPDENLIRLSLIQRTPQSERPVNSTITPYTWNSIDIPISDFTSQTSFLVTAIYQLKMEGSGWYPTNTGVRPTVYIDNIYFYKAVPGVPTIGTATAGNGKASVAFSAPSVTGGTAITGYTVTSSPAGGTATGASSPLIVNGLTNGTAYTFTVTATNTQGTGAASAASNEVTPHAITNIIEVGTSSSVLDLSLTGVSDLKVLNGITLTGNAEKTVNSITVESGGKLNVSSGSPLIVGTLTFKAIKDASSFSSKLDAGITATTVRLFKTIDDTKWYFMAFPCDVAVAGITKSDGSEMTGLGTDWFIKYYDGNKRSIDGVSSGSNWVSVLDGTLTAKKGYIFGLKTGKPETEILFPLNPSILTAETESTVPVLSYSAGSAGTNHLGWNLVGQPYLSKYNANTNTSAPSFMVMPNVDGKTYTVTSKVANSLPEVNPFAAYFVQSGSNGNISFALTSRQNAPSSVANNVSENIQLNVSTATGVDNTYLIMDNDQTTDYQIGEDMEKWIGTGTDKPQVYTMLGGINYAFNALPMSNVVNLPIGFYTKTSGNSTISVNASQAPSLSKLLLTDISNGTTIDLLASNYNFIADAGTDNSRFVITAQRVPTDNNLINNSEGESGISIVNGKLLIVNLKQSTVIRVYDATGRLVITKTANNSSMEIPLSVVGLYTVQIGLQTRKIINKK
jgi:hypothetical protein